MSIRARIIHTAAVFTHHRLKHEAANAVRHQQEWFQRLIRKGARTTFGKDHHVDKIRSHQDFIDRIPVRDYEDLKGYIQQIIDGHRDVLWPGVPIYFAKTSGTTSGVKYIPITKDSISNHIDNARNGLFNMAALLDLKNLFDGRMIFLSGSPVLEKKGNIPSGRLSGIVNHWIPAWLKTHQMPTYETNCIDDWETKVDKIVAETLLKDMRLISGIPPWVLMYYEKLISASGKPDIQSIFPNLGLFVYGGVQYEPYRLQIENLTGRKIPSLETYPASEGFIAFQDTPDVNDGLLLQCNKGILFEFIPLSEIHTDNPKRVMIDQVELGVDYAVIMTTNAGLWAYSIGDTVEFVSRDPYRLRVTGRIKHFISAFGEHVIAREVEEALRIAVQEHPCLIAEFTVAPQVNPKDGAKPYHEWWIEFGSPPQDLHSFASTLNNAMVKQNLYYADLIEGKILRPLVVRSMPHGAFNRYMYSIGKLGGQNKIPRLSNDRVIADALEALPR